MPWTETSPMGERLIFIAACLHATEPFSVICLRQGISRKTGYKWLNRFKQEGHAGLADRSRRPHSSPKRTKESVERAILTVRDEHVARGAHAKSAQYSLITCLRSMLPRLWQAKPQASSTRSTSSRQLCRSQQRSTRYRSTRRWTRARSFVAVRRWTATRPRCTSA